MISIAMTTYNGAKYVKKQLESLKVQTMPLDEVIIVDDFSKDDTCNIVENYIKQNKLKNWKFIKNTENHGYIYSFRKSVQNTTGDIIFLCDQDDIWCETKIEEMVKIINSNEEILALSCSFKKIDANDEPIMTKNKPFHSNNNLIRKFINKNAIKKINYKECMIYNISPGCTLALKKEIKEEFLKTNIDLPHDWTINLIAAQKEGLYFYNKPLIRYRIHSNNTLGLKKNRTYASRIKILENSLKEKQMMQKIYPNNLFLKDTISFYEKRLNALKSHSKAKIFANLLYALIKRNTVDSCAVDYICSLKEL